MISFKKIIKDFKGNIIQFIVLVTLIILSVFLFIGLFTFYWNTDESYNKAVNDSNVAEYIVIKDSLNDLNLNEINQENIQTTLKLTANQDNNIIIEFNYILKNSISKFTVIEGEEFNLDNDKVWIDYYYCLNNGCEVGDYIRLENDLFDKEYQIAGLVYSPDYIAYNLNENSLFPDYSKQGYVYLSRDIAEISKTYNIIYTKHISKQDIEKHFGSETIVEINDYYSYSALNSEMNQSLIMSIVFPVVFLLVVLITLYVVIIKYMTLEKSNIKLFYSLGFGKKKIIKNYKVFLATIIFFSVLLGAILGSTILYPSLVENQNEALKFVNRDGISIKLIICISTVYFITLTTLSYFIISKRITKSIFNKENNTKSDTYKIRLGENISYFKWGIRQIFLNLFRSIGTLLALIFAIAVFMSALGLNDTVKKSEEQTFNMSYLFEYSTSDENLFDTSVRDKVKYYYESYNCNLESRVNEQSFIIDLSTYKDNEMYKLIDKNNKAISFKEDDVYISSYLAEKYDISINNVINVNDKNIKVTGIYESSNSRKIFISESNFNDFSIFQYDTTYYWDENLEISNKNIILTTVMQEEYLSQTKSLEEIIWIEIIIALIIFTAILNNTFSLIKINKIREISTLKVLGAENSILTLLIVLEVIIIFTIATFFSIPLSKFILKLIINPLKNTVYFDPEIKLQSYLLVIVSALIILLLNIIIMAFNVKNIKMSEALKLVEQE